ncbi:MAG TPA: ABC transporter ATP-binding protein [Syntrophales bacterium]|nr:ABC transporter ATP-binding protein [Syntrophales bacterium]
MSLLVCNQVSKHFGGLKAVDRVDLSVEEGEIIGLIGPNGAGKTTLFNLITGFLDVTDGTILYEGRDITRQPSHIIAAHGMIRTFQKINIFRELSVLDNVLIGHHIHIKSNFLHALLHSRKKLREETQMRKESLEILEKVGLGGWANRLAKNLPLGLQRALGIAVGLAAHPKLLLLDEPASGMNTEETRYIMEVIRDVHKSGITILMVEHDMNVVMNLCERLVVLDFGKVVSRGTPLEIQNDPNVIEVYLGKGYKHVAAH